MTESPSVDSFGHPDFTIDRVKPGYPDGCPVIGCSTGLIEISYGKRSVAPFCPTHGIRLHSDTFVYWNGSGDVGRQRARRRNCQIQHHLFSEVAKGKVESHRLGYEMSEDALSWNVFVALAEAKRLRDAVSFLTGRSIEDEPRLYLWRQLIDLAGGGPGRFAPLDAVRARLEKGISKFLTEPDIMLVVGEKLIICIEAKFGSGNPLAHESKARVGDKPTDRDGLLSRYLDGAGAATQAMIDRQGIGDEFHSQLFRNVIFASEMAGRGDWHVVNLVSKTQWDVGKNSSRCSYGDPEPLVRAYLREDVRNRFTYRTWESLHESLVKSAGGLEQLDEYMWTKSAHFRPALTLS
jgi:hypothetical protein